MNRPAARRPVASPEDQGVTFVELFFDLVFVFAVTQTVSLLHDGLSWASVGRAVLVFWLVWWAWTQFTWTLNAADTTHTWVELSTLAATAFAFFMAVALPDAFGERALWFAATYVLVRAVGLILYIWVSRGDSRQRATVRTFSLVSLGGLAAVLLGGLAGGAALYWLWGLAIVLDIAAVTVGARSEGWNLRPEHFAERHGLFVIIALGETLIVAAGGVTGAAWTGELLAVAGLAVAVSCALWWSYFPNAKPVLGRALASRRGFEQSSLARDVYTLLHFPVLCGVIAYAFVVEEAVAHPADPLPFSARLALALGLALFVGGVAVAVRRATGRVLVARVVLTLITAIAVVAVAAVAPWVTLTLGFVGVVMIALLEQLGGPLAKVPT